MTEDVPTRQGVSAALAAAQAQAAVAASVRFPGEDGGRSLAAMAQRDLDAALQLLADRAQYITGASGAAIALRRDGRDDMLCRASAGTNAPELGALLSAEFGLSGESVRTRTLMRCDDAERDARVNREVCRQMGIASVLVMPVVNDDQVLGVFELFSGKTNAFGERDLSAVQRLSEMVETAVRLAQASENLSEQLAARETAVAEAVHPEVFEGQFLSDLVVEENKQRADERGQPREPHSVEAIAAAALESPIAEANSAKADQELVLPEPPTQAVEPQPGKIEVATAPVSSKKPILLWSAAISADGELARTENSDQSHVPPILRGLRKCEACGFPISAGRVLCVECEEKKWRGQLRPQSAARKPPTGVAAVSSPRPASPSSAATAPSMAKTPPGTQNTAESIQKRASISPDTAPVKAEESGKITAISPEPVAIHAQAGPPEFVLSAGIEPSRSWFSANKYIVLALLVIGGTVAAFLLLR